MNLESSHIIFSKNLKEVNINQFDELLEVFDFLDNDSISVFQKFNFEKSNLLKEINEKYSLYLEKYNEYLKTKITFQEINKRYEDLKSDLIDNFPSISKINDILESLTKNLNKVLYNTKQIDMTSEIILSSLIKKTNRFVFSKTKQDRLKKDVELQGETIKLISKDIKKTLEYSRPQIEEIEAKTRDLKMPKIELITNPLNEKIKEINTLGNNLINLENKIWIIKKEIEDKITILGNKKLEIKKYFRKLIEKREANYTKNLHSKINLIFTNKDINNN